MVIYHVNVACLLYISMIFVLYKTIISCNIRERRATSQVLLGYNVLCHRHDTFKLQKLFIVFVTTCALGMIQGRIDQRGMFMIMVMAINSGILEEL